MSRARILAGLTDTSTVPSLALLILSRGASSSVCSPSADRLSAPNDAGSTSKLSSGPPLRELLVAASRSRLDMNSTPAGSAVRGGRVAVGKGDVAVGGGSVMVGEGGDRSGAACNANKAAWSGRRVVGIPSSQARCKSITAPGVSR